MKKNENNSCLIAIVIFIAFIWLVSSPISFLVVSFICLIIYLIVKNSNHCIKCNGKVGFFQTINDPSKKNEKTRYCSKCYKELMEKRNEERLSKIKPTLEKYFSKCNETKIRAISMLYSDKKIFEKVGENDLKGVKDYCINIHSNIEYNISKGDYNDLDASMNSKHLCEIIIDFLDDLEKMLKIFTRKNIETNYPELIELFYNLRENIIKKKDKIFVNFEYLDISTKLKKNINIKNVLREYISPVIKTIKQHGIDMNKVKLLLNKFNLKYNDEELENLVKELIEEINLDNFEENIGGEKQKKFLSNYAFLNGHQFESYLKQLFEALNYTVVHTKLSGDQGADLIIMKSGEKTAVQSKKYSGKVSNKAIQEVVAAREHYKCKNAMVVTTGIFTKSAVQLAISNNVKLWDKNKLNQIINEINSSTEVEIKASQNFILTDDPDNPLFGFICPYCHAYLFKQINQNQFPNRNEKIEIKCCECGKTILINISKKLVKEIQRIIKKNYKNRKKTNEQIKKERKEENFKNKIININNKSSENRTFIGNFIENNHNFLAWTSKEKKQLITRAKLTIRCYKESEKIDVPKKFKEFYSFWIKGTKKLLESMPLLIEAIKEPNINKMNSKIKRAIDLIDEMDKYMKQANDKLKNIQYIWLNIKFVGLT